MKQVSWVVAEIGGVGFSPNVKTKPISNGTLFTIYIATPLPSTYLGHEESLYVGVDPDIFNLYRLFRRRNRFGGSLF